MSDGEGRVLIVEEGQEVRWEDVAMINSLVNDRSREFNAGP